MAQKNIKYNFLSKRLVEQTSANRFVFYQNNISENGIKRASRISSSAHYPKNSFWRAEATLLWKKRLNSYFYRQFRSDAPLSIFKEHRSDSVCNKMMPNILQRSVASTPFRHFILWVISRISSSGSSNFSLRSICFYLICIFSLGACGEPEIKLDRAARRSIDTLVNYQLDSISPILDSFCKNTREDFIQHAVDSIVKERQKKEERLRLNISNDQ